MNFNHFNYRRTNLLVVNIYNIVKVTFLTQKMYYFLFYFKARTNLKVEWGETTIETGSGV